MLKINSKKTKILVFQKGKYKCDYVFHIGNEMIDIVPDYTYLGTRISPIPEILHIYLNIFDKKPLMFYLV